MGVFITVRDLLNKYQKDDLVPTLIYFDADKKDTISRIGLDGLVSKEGHITENELEEYIEIIKNIKEEFYMIDFANITKEQQDYMNTIENIEKHNDGATIKRIPKERLKHLIDKKFKETNKNCSYFIAKDFIKEENASENSIIISNAFNYCRLKFVKGSLSIFEGPTLSSLKLISNIILDNFTIALMKTNPNQSFITYIDCLQECYKQIQSIKNLSNSTIKAIMQINGFSCLLSSQIYLPSYITKKQFETYVQDCDCNGNLMISIHKNYCPKFRMNITFADFKNSIELYNIKQKMMKKEKWNFISLNLIENKIVSPESNNIEKLSDWLNEYVNNAKSDEPESYDYYIEPDDLKYYPYWKI